MIESVALRDLCDVRHGGTPSKAVADYWRGDIPWISPKDMKAPEIDGATDHISTDGVANSATSVVPPGTVLIVVRSGILVHSVPIARTLRPVAFNQDIKALIPKSPLIEPEYLFWFVRGQEERILTRGIKKGATVHSVRSGFIETLPVPLLDRKEQQRIVDVLGRAEGIIRLRREALKKTQEVIPALFVDVFGDPATNPKAWPVVGLGTVADVQGGLQISKARAALPIEVPYLRVANVHRSKLDLSEIKQMRVTPSELARTRLARGDLLVVEGHGNPEEIGRVAGWDGSIEHCVHQNHLIRVRCDVGTLNTDFGCEFLNSFGGRSSLLRSGKTTSGLNTISVSNVKAVPIVLPPIDRQLDFAARVGEVRSIRAQQAVALGKAEAAFEALLAGSFVANREASHGR